MIEKDYSNDNFTKKIVENLFCCSCNVKSSSCALHRSCFCLSAPQSLAIEDYSAMSFFFSHASDWASSAFWTLAVSWATKRSTARLSASDSCRYVARSCSP